MATEAQVRANRLNAQSSTGPRTAQGRETASQNALKHGLFAREGVIRGEDREEFEMHREMLLEQLNPVGPLEGILAARIVDLTWRLRRAAQDQNEAFGAMYERHTAGAPVPEEPDERAATLGRMILEDFGQEAVLERLLRYERRIESSLYRTLNELRRVHEQGRKADQEVADTRERWREEDWQAKKARAFAFGPPLGASSGPAGGTTNTPRADAPHPSDIPSLQDANPAPNSPPGADRRETNPISERVSSWNCEVSSESCKTNPISPDPNEGQSDWGKEVGSDSYQNGHAETG